jgi:hypothetical protein
MPKPKVQMKSEIQITNYPIDKTNTNALNSFNFAPLTLSLSPPGRGRGEGDFISTLSLAIELTFEL